MPKERSPYRDKAKEIYLQSKGQVSLVDIAQQLDVSEGTVRGWKSKDNWDGNGTLQSKDMERSNQGGKDLTLKKSKKRPARKVAEEAKPKTNTNMQSSKARYGNKNAQGNAGGRGAPIKNQYAVGNKGGNGGPIKNKHALKTGEFETIFFTADIIDDEERALLDTDYDKYIMQYLLIDTLTIREKRILKRIKEVESIPGGMVYESVTENKGNQTTKFINRNKEGDEWDGNDMSINQDNSSRIAKTVLKKVMELEEVLNRVQGRKQAAIAQLHRMEVDDERLSIDCVKLEIYKQRISGRLDLDALFDDDLELDLED